jgi:hypothetical protein
MRTYAKEEFLDAVKHRAQVKCAYIEANNPLTAPFDDIVAALKLNYTEEDFTKFLDKLNFFYDASYGTQEVFGTIWLVDGTWFSRGEYDGSEWWQYHVRPEIIAACK